ncbi:MAG: hypothetical protein ACLS9Y_14405 [Ruthenibacterium lactatiformans]
MAETIAPEPEIFAHSFVKSLTTTKGACGDFPCSATRISGSEVRRSFGPTVLDVQCAKTAWQSFVDCQAV